MFGILCIAWFLFAVNPADAATTYIFDQTSPVGTVEGTITIENGEYTDQAAADALNAATYSINLGRLTLTQDNSNWEFGVQRYPSSNSNYTISLITDGSTLDFKVTAESLGGSVLGLLRVAADSNTSYSFTFTGGVLNIPGYVIGFQRTASGTEGLVFWITDLSEWIDLPITRTFTYSFPAADNDDTISYVALGDSFSSGEGAGDYSKETDCPHKGPCKDKDGNDYTNQCHRSKHAYSQKCPGGDDWNCANYAVPLVDSDPPLLIKRKFFACSGAKTRDITSCVSPPKYPEDEKTNNCKYGDPDHKAQINQPGFDSSVDLVTLSIGGNDVYFAEVVKKCLLNKNCANEIFACPNTPIVNWFCNDTETVGMKVFSKIEDLMSWALMSDGYDGLQQVYKKIKDKTDKSPVFVLGYPDILPHPDTLPPDGEFEASQCNLLSAAQRFSQDERKFLTQVRIGLNKAVECAAARAGVHFVDVMGTGGWGFQGHELCGPDADWINPVFFGRKVESLHPNRLGHFAYAKLINNYIKNTCEQNPERCHSGIPANPEPVPEADVPDACKWKNPLKKEQLVFSAVALMEEVPLPSTGDLIVEPAVPLSCDHRESYVPSQDLRITGRGFEPFTAVALELKANGGNHVSALGVFQADGEGKLDVTASIPPEAPTTDWALIEAFGQGPVGEGRVLMTMIALAPSLSADSDNDGIPDVCDNCPETASPDLTDTDGDGVGDACDACLLDFENDYDGDGLCSDEDSCQFDPDNDIDGDGLCAQSDNCPTVNNPDQTDADNDGVGDACEGNILGDLNGDGVLDFATDFQVFMSLFGQPVDPPGTEPDYDGDGFVGLADYSIFLSLFNPPG